MRHDTTAEQMRRVCCQNKLQRTSRFVIPAPRDRPSFRRRVIPLELADGDPSIAAARPAQRRIHTRVGLRPGRRTVQDAFCRDRKSRNDESELRNRVAVTNSVVQVDGTRWPSKKCSKRGIVTRSRKTGYVSAFRSEGVQCA
eukprot:2278530-Pleurochrysis_carterae.AAC.1